MERQWVTHQFETATRNSNTLGVIVVSFTNNALKGPQGVPPLSAHLNTLAEGYIMAFDELRIQEGIRKSCTVVTKDLFKGLIVAARDWDNNIQRVYAKGSAEYTALLPKGRKPFYSGKAELRIRAINQLSMAIGTDAQLVAVKTQVDGYYTAITAANDAQKSAIALRDIKSAAVETARLAACKGLEFVKNGLQQLFADDPAKVDSYFRLDLIRSRQQMVYTGRVPVGGIKDVAKRTFKLSSLLDITNHGMSGLQYYLAETKGGPVPAGTVPIMIPPGATETVLATALGSLANKYLIVRNPSELVEGEWEVNFAG